ncbi:MAG: type VI secretion system baseplate subunit TssG [Pirellulales bacterium]
MENSTSSDDRQGDSGGSTAGPMPHRPAVATRLLNEYYEFDFFQAVRILERLQQQRQGVGGDASPQQECARFRSLPSLTFPPSSIAALAPPGPETVSGEPGRPPEMTVAFLGLTGPSGALPRYYTELLMERLRQKDRTLHDFLDLFHHRLTSLFYRAWQKYRFWLRFEKAEIVGRREHQDTPERQKAFLTDVRPRLDRFSQIVLDLAGLGNASLRYSASQPQQLVHRSALTDDTMRFYAGLLGNSHRPANGLERLLAEYFEVPVEVCQCMGQWLLIELDDQSRVSGTARTVLGENAVVGERFRDLQGRFRVRIGPIAYADYLRYLPPGTNHRPLGDLSRLYAGHEYDIEVQLVLARDEIPPAQLSADTSTGPRLGWNVWLHSQPLTEDRGDAILNLASTAESLSA